MNTVGIITEYNPFHYGHLYHLEKSKKITNSDTVICVMNGNFMQRGQAPLTDKWVRTQIALANGVDMVIELPLVYGIRSAEYFAKGAISILVGSGIVNRLVFGSEVGEITPLAEAADILLTKDNYFQTRLQKYIAEGLSFPSARERAVSDYIAINPDISIDSRTKLLDVITLPNNILGIEYLKALREINSTIEANTIKRSGSGYHDRTLENKISSATAIREKIYNSGLESTINYLPENTYTFLKNEEEKNKLPINDDLLGIMILASIRKKNSRELSTFAEMEDGLSNRILKQAHLSSDIDDLIDKLKTKAYTRTRIKRNLLHILFNIHEKDFNLIDQSGPQYIRVLGIRKERQDLLSILNKNSSLEVIINPAGYLKEIDITSDNPMIKSLSYDILASDIYSLLYKNPAYRQGHKDFTTPLIKY